MKNNNEKEANNEIWIGNNSNAMCKWKLDKQHIKNILTLDGITPYYPSYFKYKSINMLRCKDEEFVNYLKETTEFLKEQKETNTLIHSESTSRIYVVIIAYIMVTSKVKYDHAIDFLKRKGLNINLHDSYIERLKQFEKTMKKEKCSIV